MPPTSIEESLPHTLRLHGEAFMSMFEDSGDERRREVGTGTDQERETGPAPAAAKDAAAADAAKETAGKKSRKKNKKRRALDTPAMANPTSHPRVARNVDEMDAIFGSIKNGDTGDEDKGDEDGEADDSRQGRKSSAKKKHKGKPNKSTSSASIPDAGERERQQLEEERQQLEEELLRRKIERKRFMASDTDSMLSLDEEAMLAEAKKRIDRSQTAGRGGGFDKRKDMEEFKAIRREIQSFGTSRWGDSRPRLSRFPAFFAFLVVLADARMNHVRNVRKRRVSSHAPCATRRRPASVPEFFWRHLRPFILEQHIGS